MWGGAGWAQQLLRTDSLCRPSVHYIRGVRVRCLGHAFLAHTLATLTPGPWATALGRRRGWGSDLHTLPGFGDIHYGILGSSGPVPLVWYDGGKYRNFLLAAD